MADFCNQCKIELGLNQEHDSSDYPDYGPLEEGCGWAVICEGCGPIRIDRFGNCMETQHVMMDGNVISMEIHKKLDIPAGN